jgi:hypothetical protein
MLFISSAHEIDGLAFLVVVNLRNAAFHQLTEVFPFELFEPSAVFPEHL